MVLIPAATAVVLANVSSEPVTIDLLSSDKPERAYGWPFTWYWRAAERTETNVSLNDVFLSYHGKQRLLHWPVSRFNWSSLADNLAAWLLILVAASSGRAWLWRRYRPQLHWRPRMATLVMLTMVASLIVLANLSFGSPSWWKASFGWPLIWYWYAYVGSKGLGAVRCWDYSAARLCGNIVIWALSLGLVGLACEWLLRRYQVRWRWSLRTQLGALTLASLGCAWCAGVRDRAREQDALIAWASDSNVFVERWGPIWLDVVGADPFRRRVVGAELFLGKKRDRDFPRHLTRWPSLRYLAIDADLFEPGTAAVLGSMPQLRTLTVVGSPGHDDEAERECLAWLGKLRHIEVLHVHWPKQVQSGGPAFPRRPDELKVVGA